MNALIQNACIFGAVLSGVLLIIVATKVYIAPDMWVGDYSPDIKENTGR